MSKSVISLQRLTSFCLVEMFAGSMLHQETLPVADANSELNCTVCTRHEKVFKKKLRIEVAGVAWRT